MNKEEFEGLCRHLDKNGYFAKWDVWWKSLSPPMQKQFDDAFKKYVNEYHKL